MAFLQHDMFL